MIRTAMVSFWHVHAADYARAAQQHPGVELVAGWDADEARGRARCQELGLRFEPDLDRLLADGGVDAVIVDTPTDRHPDVLTRAAGAGKHIYTEKVVATTTADCRAVLAAVRAAGVRMVVSLPRLAHGYTLAVQDLLARGALGTVTQVRVRLSHNGAVGTGWLPAYFYDPVACGGGALMDLGAHPVYLTRLFLGGMPDTVTASFGYLTGRAVEDNAVATLRRADGAVGVVEAGFVNRHSPFTVEVHGTEGSLLYGTPDERLLVRSAPLGHQGWTELPLPANLPDPFHQWVDHIEQGTEATGNLAAALDLTRLMEAAYTAARTGRATRPVD
jgi:predicted dehydrogenase